jgi:hypothetical protein
VCAVAAGSADAIVTTAEAVSVAELCDFSSLRPLCEDAAEITLAIEKAQSAVAALHSSATTHLSSATSSMADQMYECFKLAVVVANQICTDVASSDAFAVLLPATLQDEAVLTSTSVGDIAAARTRMIFVSVKLARDVIFVHASKGTVASVESAATMSKLTQSVASYSCALASFPTVISEVGGVRSCCYIVPISTQS